MPNRRTRMCTGAVERLTRPLTHALMFAALFTLSGVSAAGADSSADFYRGRTVSVIVGFEPGSGNDLLTRLIAKFMGEQMPGKPTFVVQNMPGVGGLKAANFLYNVAPRDGSAFGFIGRTALLAPLLNPESASFDAQKFNWLGSASKTVVLGLSWYTSSVKTLSDATERELIVGSPTATSEETWLTMLCNTTLGTKFKIVTGYPETQLELAMERGEIAGQIGVSYDSLLTTHPDWIRQRKVNLLLQSGFEKDQRLLDVPLAIDGAKAPADRQLMEFLFSIYEIARPFVAPPEVPAERIGALRNAFMATVREPRFLAEAAKAGIEISGPTASDRMTEIIAKAYATPDSTVARARQLFAALQAPTPARVPK
jgi:tripartite-type tricarboxylate transporter receptor subunit TctC